MINIYIYMYVCSKYVGIAIKISKQYYDCAEQNSALQSTFVMMKLKCDKYTRLFIYNNSCDVDHESEHFIHRRA